MLIVCVADVVSLPATSVTTTWRSAGPSASVPVASDWLYVEPTVGAVCVPKTVKAPAPVGLISKRTAETPEAGGTGPSEAFAVTVIAPATYDGRGGGGDRSARRGVVDRLRQAGQQLVRNVAGGVGDDRAEVVLTVGDERRAPRGLIRRGDVGGADVRPAVGSCGGELELDGADVARAGRVAEVRDSAQVVAGVAARAARRRGVDDHVDRVGRCLDVADVIGREERDGVRAVVRVVAGRRDDHGAALQQRAAVDAVLGLGDAGAGAVGRREADRDGRVARAARSEQGRRGRCRVVDENGDGRGG